MRHAALAALLALALVACRSKPQTIPDDLVEGAIQGKGVVHVVERGQTLWRIARAYEVSLQDLAEVNDVQDPAQIRVGQKLWVPGARTVLHVAPAPSLVKDDPKPEPKQDPKVSGQAKVTPPPKAAPRDDDEPAPKLDVRKSRFIWPVQGALYSRFGVRDGTQHDGIDISAPKGTPVVAADAGDVLFSGEQRGYGNIVLVRHADGLITIYAHHDENLVRTGAQVARGQKVGLVGQTGRASGPHLHFEVRKDRVPRNPLFFLPE